MKKTSGFTSLRATGSNGHINHAALGRACCKHWSASHHYPTVVSGLDTQVGLVLEATANGLSCLQAMP